MNEASKGILNFLWVCVCLAICYFFLLEKYSILVIFQFCFLVIAGEVYLRFATAGQWEFKKTLLLFPIGTVIIIIVIYVIYYLIANAFINALS